MKRFLFYLAILTLLWITGCSTRQQVITFNHVTYHYQSSADAAQLYQSDAGQTLRLETSDQGASVTVDSQVYLVSGSADDLQVVLPGGLQVSRHYDANSSYGGAAPDAVVSLEDWDRVDELRSIVFKQGRNQSSATVWRYLLGLLLLATGVLQVANPRLAWQISEGWRYTNLEPSDIYLALSRLGGVVVILAGLFVLFGVI